MIRSPVSSLCWEQLEQEKRRMGAASDGETKQRLPYSAVRDDDLVYEEKDRMGDGLSGVVYRARYNGADIAAKFLRSVEVQSAALETAFKRERGMMTAFPPHPNVVTFLGASTGSAAPHILVMTLMRGSLEKLLLEDRLYLLDFARAKTDPEVAKLTLTHLRHVVWFLVGASAGLMHLHANRVVHGDVAARNLLVDYNMNCCLCDFGMSVELAAGANGAEAHVPLPVAWCSPETLQKHWFSEKTDVYSFGITIAEILGRRQPYPGMDLTTEVGPGVCKPKQALRPQTQSWWPKELVDIFLDCVAGQPVDRPTMGAVNRKLHRYHQNLINALTLDEVYNFKD